MGYSLQKRPQTVNRKQKNIPLRLIITHGALQRFVCNAPFIIFSGWERVPSPNL